MKWIILATTLALSGTAVAQTAPAPDPAQTVPQQPVTTVTTTTDASGTPTTTVNVASPGNYTPPPPADPPSSYPPCSRTVTDHCKQRHDPK